MRNLRRIFLFLFLMVLMRPAAAFPISVDAVTFETEGDTTTEGNEVFAMSPSIVYINFFDIPTRKVDRIILGSVVLKSEVDITFTHDSNKAFLPLYDSTAIINVNSKRVHKVASGSVTLASDKDTIKIRDCSNALFLLNQFVGNPAAPLNDVDRVAFGSGGVAAGVTFTPDCGKGILPVDDAIVVIDITSKRVDKIFIENVDFTPKIAVTPDGSKVLFLSPANASIVIVDIVSKRVEIVHLEDVLLTYSSKIFITPDGDTAIFLSYAHNYDNLVYGYGAAGSGCIVCGGLFAPLVEGPIGKVTWNKIGDPGTTPGSPYAWVPYNAPVNDPDEFTPGVPEEDSGTPGSDGDGGSVPPRSGGGDTITPVPEPGTLLLLGSGLIGLAWIRRKLKIKR